jgi:hypothetical protein
MTSVSRGGYPGIEVNPEALRIYATQLEAFKDRFTALTGASESVTHNDEAFGPAYSGWMEPLLEAKHVRAHMLIGSAQDTLDTHILALQQCADDYETADEAAASELNAQEDQF